MKGSTKRKKGHFSTLKQPDSNRNGSSKGLKVEDVKRTYLRLKKTTQKKVDCIPRNVQLVAANNELPENFETTVLLRSKQDSSFLDCKSMTAENIIRRVIWEDNVRFIERHNMAADRGEHTYWLGINHFADMSEIEVNQKMKGCKKSNDVIKEGSLYLPPNNVEIPEEVDWRQQGYGTSVKIQLDNDACAGNWMYSAFQYVEDNNGIDTETSYSYEAKNGTCRFQESDVGAADTGYTKIPQSDEQALKSAVATVGPISIAIDADKKIQLYKRGIFDEPACNASFTNHAVLIVEYGVQNEQDYWLVKNSWNESWGLDGYIKMLRNKNNQCGIVSYAMYPLV